jgi:hypothetical protein
MSQRLQDGDLASVDKKRPIEAMTEHSKPVSGFDDDAAFSSLLPEGAEQVNACYTCGDRHAEDPESRLRREGLSRWRSEQVA